jgi:hypothetical protein
MSETGKSRMKNMTKRTLLLGSALLLTTVFVLPATDVLGFDEPIPTKVSLLKWGGKPRVGKLYKIVSNPLAGVFPLPAVGSGPDVNGGELTVQVGAGQVTCSLNNTTLWKGLGKPAGVKGYKYVNKSAPTGDLCKIVIVKEKVIKVLAKGVGTVALPGAFGTNPDVQMQLVAGFDRYCAEARNPHFKEKEDTLIKMKIQPPPGACGGPTTTIITSSTTTITATSTTTSTTIPSSSCGDCQVDPGETCDDCNTDDNDLCPSDCRVDDCIPLISSSFPLEVSFTPPAGANIGGVTVLLIYPEGKVEIPGPPIPPGVITDLPPGAFPIALDLDHALRGTVAITGVIPPGPLFTVNFRQCEGADAPGAWEFACRVLDATDPFSNPVAGVTCTVASP